MAGWPTPFRSECATLARHTNQRPYMPRQKLYYSRSGLQPPDTLVDAARRGNPATVARCLAENPAWAWADHLLLLTCRVPVYEGHGGTIAESDKRQRERAEIARLFVEAGAPPTLCNNRKVTPLHMACRFDLPLVARELLALGATADAYDVARETPLFRAVNLGYAECVRVLLDAGADPNFANRRGETLLHRAAQRGKRLLVPMLLAAGARPEAVDRSGNAPLHYARNKTIRLALEAAAGPKQPPS